MILKEETEKYGEKINQIEDPIIRKAADAGCIPDSNSKIINFSISHPISKKNVVLVKTDETEFVNDKQKRLFSFVTSIPAPNKPNYYKLEYVYYDNNKYIFTRTADWTCPNIGKKEEIEKKLKTNLYFRSKNDINANNANYELVDVLEDSKSDNQYRSKVDGWGEDAKILEKYQTKLMMWKPRKTESAQFNISDKTNEKIEYFTGQGYSPCTIEQSEKGLYATINLQELYPNTFVEDYFVCKPWDEIDTNTKRDCIGVIDGYYNLIKKYKRTPQRRPSVENITVQKNAVISCLSNFKQKMPFRKKKIKEIENLDPKYGQPFYLGKKGYYESKDNLTNIIRESLRIVKERKNYY
jgi:hypothetical protein